MNVIKKAKENIDPSIVVSTLAASVVIGMTVYGMKQAGMGKAATIVKGG